MPKYGVKNGELYDVQNTKHKILFSYSIKDNLPRFCNKSTKSIETRGIRRRYNLQHFSYILE